MPQLTLSFNTPTKSLSLSQASPRSAPRPAASPSTHRRSASGASAAYHQPGPNNLWLAHHEEEAMAAAGANRRKAKAEGKEVHMRDEEDGEDGKHVQEEHDGGEGEEDAKGNGKGRAKGLPGDAKKRERSPEGGGVAGPEAKRHKNAYEIKGKVATAEDAARVDEQPPLDTLMALLKDKKKEAGKGECVVYWMRMEDVRIEDNTALALASTKAKELGVPLVWLFVLSPGDYKWHDRSTRRIDFMLRNLRVLKPQFDKLNIPLSIHSYDKRLSIPRHLVNEVLPTLGANHVYCNMEYEVDELRRDIATVKLGRDKGIDVVPVHDRLVVPPGRIKSQQGRPMSVFSPWQRQWAKIVDNEPDLLELSPNPEANPDSVKKHKVFGKLFSESQIPDYVEGFKCEDAEQMKISWPEGLDRARELLQRFLHTKPRTKLLQLVSPLEDGAEEDTKNSRVNQYQTGRNLVNGDNSSRLSPYLASGVISARMVLQEAKKMNKKGKLESGRDTGVGMWVQEVSWRDFYNHIMCTWPRVSMGRPFLEKFADVQWEVSEDNLQAWKEGKTGYPIVDAAMRACSKRGWLENRLRMVTASFLVKSMLLDWRLGEKHFMEQFIDGDLAANNGGWQWTASTGTDPQPYFRIFNTITQSEKCDPNGDYIRYWVPELKNLKGKAIHDPFHSLPSGEFKKLGYPKPIVDHKISRERALFRYKNVGEKEA